MFFVITNMRTCIDLFCICLLSVHVFYFVITEWGPGKNSGVRNLFATRKFWLCPFCFCIFLLSVSVFVFVTTYMRTCNFVYARTLCICLSVFDFVITYMRTWQEFWRMQPACCRQPTRGRHPEKQIVAAEIQIQVKKNKNI